MVNQKVQAALKKFQDNKNEEHKKSQKWIKELREDFNKYQSETKDTIKRDKWNKDDNTKYKRGVEQRCGNPQKKNQAAILEIKSPISQRKNTVEATPPD
jgi:hypothetical protein